MRAWSIRACRPALEDSRGRLRALGATVLDTTSSRGDSGGDSVRSTNCSLAPCAQRSLRHRWNWGAASSMLHVPGQTVLRDGAHLFPWPPARLALLLVLPVLACTAQALCMGSWRLVRLQHGSLAVVEVVERLPACCGARDGPAPRPPLRRPCTQPAAGAISRPAAQFIPLTLRPTQCLPSCAAAAHRGHGRRLIPAAAV